MSIWIEGFFFSIAVGGVVVALFLKAIRAHLGIRKGEGKRVPAWLLGGIERAFFTLIVALGAPDAITAMFAWLALKLASNWLNPELDKEYQIKNWRVSALLAGVISMAFAYLGGMIVCGNIPPPTHWVDWRSLLRHTG